MIHDRHHTADNSISKSNHRGQSAGRLLPVGRHAVNLHANMTAILGISAFYHDSAAAILVDGQIAAAAQEERFTRKKHDQSFPTNAIDYCLSAAGLEPGQLDYVGFYDKPLLKFERILETYLACAPLGFRSFAKAMPLWLRQKLHLRRHFDRGHWAAAASSETLATRPCSP